MTEITFEDFNFNKQLLTAIREAGYTKPTPIQEKVIKVCISGHDVIGIAPTGTGKTAAFVLPMLHKLKYAQEKDPRAVILAPTRELAMQIAEHVTELAKYTGLRHAVIYGGVGPRLQTEEINKGIDILIATPGRLMDIYLKGNLILKKVNYFVIDEADKMMDMGFIGQINRILEIIPHKKQNLLFSATMPERVEQLTDNFMKFPDKIEVALQATPAATIDQQLYRVPNFKTKLNLLQELLKDESDLNRIIIFCRTKLAANAIFNFIERKYQKDEIRLIHANKAQSTRINSMNDFKEGNVRILVATDVASRGIDVSMVSHVINFDLPVIYEDYVHRIGRTGRANQSGKAITFVTPAEEYHLQKIQKIIRMDVPEIPIPKSVFIEETPFDEKQTMAMEIDIQKRRENPDFKGAFHEKKNADKLPVKKKMSVKDNKEKARTKKNKGKSFKASDKKKLR